MSQAMTVKIKLKPTNAQTEFIQTSSLAYIKAVNLLVSEMVAAEKVTKKTSKDVDAPLNSAVKNQAIRDAKSVFQKAKKSHFKNIPRLKKPVIIWNNQNFTIGPSGIKMPFVVDGKSKKIEIMADIPEYERSLLKKACNFGEYPQTDKKKS